MKRTALILSIAITLTVIACALGIIASERAENIAQSAMDFEAACMAEDASAAKQALDQARALWQRNELLFTSLCRLETCLGIERTMQEMELALSQQVYEDGISSSRELQRLCEEAGHIGWPDVSDIL